MKLQKGIVSGERKLAFALCLVALSGAYADGLTPMYGKASGTQGSIAQTVTWYSDEAMTSTANVITPWDGGSNTCRYAILGLTKAIRSSTNLCAEAVWRGLREKLAVLASKGMWDKSLDPQLSGSGYFVATIDASTLLCQ